MALETPRHLPNILFRLECHDEGSSQYNSTFKDFSMVARAPHLVPSDWLVHMCLSWKKVNTPFIPFTSDWSTALRWAERMKEEGSRRVIIIAVWAKGLSRVLSAYAAARSLGYRRTNNNPRHRLSNHYNEYLVWGGICADDYRILALFEDLEEWLAPSDKQLEAEIYQHTGIRGFSEQLRCLRAAVSRS